MRIKKKLYFWIGIFILILMVLAYLYNVPVIGDYGYTVNDSLLGILIFHNPFVLGLYFLIVIVLIVIGIKGKI